MRGMKLGVVLYSDANGVKSEFREVLDICDEVTFWFWNGKNVGGIEAQVAKLRAMIGPDKPVLLGQYMWDFGGKKPGRGAYVCPDPECLKKARKSRALERAFSAAIPPEVYDALEQEMAKGE